MSDRDLILRGAILAALGEHGRARSLSVAEVADAAALVLGVPSEPNRVVLPVLQGLARDGCVANTSRNPQRTAWRFVHEGERLAQAERKVLRTSARAAAKSLRGLGVSSATANRGAVRVSISAHDAERLAALLSRLAGRKGAAA